MHTRLALLVLPLFAVVFIAGCQTDQRAAPSGERQVGARAVPVVDQVHGNDAALEQPRVALIQDRAALARLNAEDLSNLNVNFSEYDLVVFAMGEQPTGGYWAHITGVQQVGEALYVQATVNRPADDEPATQALTYPYAAAVIPKTDATIALSDVDEVVGEARPE